MPDVKRCTYAGCSRPDESSHFYPIEEGRLSGGRDWTALAGHVLCHACYNRYRTSGTLEIFRKRGDVASTTGRCTYEGCERPDESRQFIPIVEGKCAGGQDWSPLLGNVLCRTCFERYKKRGTLVKSRSKPPQTAEGRCTYEGCERPDESRQFIPITEGKTTGGQDWSQLFGSILCYACFKRYKKTGSLERTYGKTHIANYVPGGATSDETHDGSHQPSNTRCSNQDCESPEREGGRLIRVDDTTRAGGQNWAPVVGRILCKPCFDKFKICASLEKSVSRPVIVGGKRCAYALCDSPEDSSQYYQIEEGMSTGGQDWSSLTGSVLCKTCYERFRKRGTLERSYHKPLAASARRCTYEGCERPEESRQFLQIGDGTTAGGRDWSSLSGSVLCETCYNRFRSKGTLEGYRNVSRHRPMRKRSPPAEAGLWVGAHETGVSSSSSKLHKRSLLDVPFADEPLKGRRCTYQGCVMPKDSKFFYPITQLTTAGGQDWSSLVGNVLCDRCFTRYSKKGYIFRDEKMAERGGMGADDDSYCHDENDENFAGEESELTSVDCADDEQC